ncbi:MAG: class I SAM-dependent methyltransferase, partial [Chloroflexota bacterium]
MAEQPQTWHYGLMAQWWAGFNVGGPEIVYFQQFIERAGQPALDVGCGTGRLLLPYLRAGLDVDGCDISPDMLDRCRDQAAREGLTPRLYAQAMHELTLPRMYRTIIVCGAFGIGGNRERDVEALRRLYRHLEPGGLLVLDNEVPYANAEYWRYWLSAERPELPAEWPVTGIRKQTSDGSELELRSRLVELEPLEQCLTLEMRIGLWCDGHLVTEEERTLKEILYFKHEVLQLLVQVGFTSIEVQAGYTGAPPT